MQKDKINTDWSHGENPEDYKCCVAFHGHDCPGLAVGYRAAQAALAALCGERAEDEELVAIVETDACGVDALQVLTGCTFGKGNLIYQDHGKHVFTLIERKSGRGVRVALKAGVMEMNERHLTLMEKVHQMTATPHETAEFWKIHSQKALEILQKPIETLFNIQPINRTLPPKARREPSRLCTRCGEPAMGSKLVVLDGREVCRDCLQPEER